MKRLETRNQNEITEIEEQEREIERVPVVGVGVWELMGGVF